MTLAERNMGCEGVEGCGGKERRGKQLSENKICGFTTERKKKLKVRV